MSRILTGWNIIWNKDKIATIQKNLTKANGFFRSKICQELGLRYAPEIRFYHDNTEEIKREAEKDGYQGIVSHKYDPNDYHKYNKELSQFISLSKVELEEYIHLNFKNEQEAENIRRLHSDV